VEAFLLLRMRPDMGGSVEHRARRNRLGRRADQWRAELLLDQREVLVEIARLSSATAPS
jgi:hypothetical protein